MRWHVFCGEIPGDVPIFNWKMNTGSYDGRCRKKEAVPSCEQNYLREGTAFLRRPYKKWGKLADYAHLTDHHLIVRALLFHKLLVVSLFQNPPIPDDQNAVCVPDCGETMSNEEAGSSFHQFQ